LPASQHIRTASAIKDNLARLLDGPDSCPPGKQCACPQEGNQKDYDHINAHKRARLYYLFQSTIIIVGLYVIRAFCGLIRDAVYGYKK
jgi:hypothetical protein